MPVHPLVELKTNPGSDSTWTWTTEDFADGKAAMETFAMRFKNAEIAGEFKAAHSDARKNNQNPTPSAEKKPAAAAASASAAASDAAPAKEAAASSAEPAAADKSA